MSARRCWMLAATVAAFLAAQVALVCAMAWGGALQGMSPWEKVVNTLFLAMKSTVAAVAQAEVMHAAEDPLARWDWMETAAALPLQRTLNVSRSTRFPVYEATDFG
ncbi:hypothetical protein E2562_017289 [Oryza meyeriana var. granulata]|uniref:Uncharacterized protein n=1 Tax=Oryza meyeriana var. granulata TaxID=110450 RepID=A0A6G1EM79_9ORYZ|nr:hypothetical protein E2562_017289 [Oryza meyeriana var. granulata]